jgi:hypothetical protein
MTAHPAPDLFAGRDAFGLPTLAGPVPDAVLIGLATLATSAPLWGDETDWLELVDRLQAFAARWHCPATVAGWSDVQLFGLDPVAPRARLSRMGGAFVACLRAHRVVAVDAEAVRVVSRTASRLSVYRPEGGGVLAWELDRARRTP